MGRNKMGTGRRLAALTAAAIVLSAVTVVSATTAAAGSRPHGEATYTVTVTNLTGGQYLTPPNFAAHTRAVDVFQPGHPASPGVQAVAENGAVPLLAAELQAAVDDAGLGVSGVAGDTPIEPGGTRTFEVTTTTDRLSIVAMVVCTNDGFAGLNAKPLPRRNGATRTYQVQAWDAGTEINTELRADLVPAPFCGPGDGTDQSNPDLAENGVIKRHRTLQGIGDLDPSLDWQGPVMRVVVTASQ